MRQSVSVFGLGYVGCVNLACLASAGVKGVGVDIKKSKTDLLNQGVPTIVEQKVDELLQQGHAQGLVSGTTDDTKAVRDTSVSLICVGTPNRQDGLLNLDYVYTVAKNIGIALRDKSEYHTIAIRSTVAPGTNFEVGRIVERMSGKVRGRDFDIVSNPEFLREGTAVDDYFHPPVTVIGARPDSPSIAIMRELYSNLPAEFEVVEVEVAEIIKYVSNSWHAAKIVFANEVGNVCQKLGIDAHAVMSLFAKDRQLNISAHYMRSGFAYGGSCLPKDLLGLIALGGKYELEMPMLGRVSESNDYQIQTAFDLVMQQAPRTVAMLGISFKEGTDDLRYSPNLKLAHKLHTAGVSLRIHDSNVYSSMERDINDIEIRNSTAELYDTIVPTLAEALDGVDTIVLGSRVPEYEGVLDLKDVAIVDLVRLRKDLRTGDRYYGLCW